MIEARFGLQRRPFQKSIPSRDLYAWPGLQELDARLEMAKQARGIMLLTGEPGTGKTVALRRFVDSLNAEHYSAVYLPLATVTVMDAYAQLPGSPGQGPGAKRRGALYGGGILGQAVRLGDGHVGDDQGGADLWRQRL